MREVEKLRKLAVGRLALACSTFLLALVTLVPSATPAQSAAGLVAGYAFNEGSGTSAVDASGGGLTGTLTNGAGWGTGRNAGAVLLDGVNDFVELGNPALLQLTGSMTVSAWVNSAAFPVDDAAIVSKRASGEVGYQLDTTVDRGPRTIGFKLTNSSGGDMFRYGATTLQANTWYHVTGVYNAATSELHVYLNGQLDDGTLLGTVTATQQNSSANVNIGRRPGQQLQLQRSHRRRPHLQQGTDTDRDPGGHEHPGRRRHRRPDTPVGCDHLAREQRPGVGHRERDRRRE